MADLTCAALPNRALLSLQGEEAAGFLNGLVSNSVTGLEPGRAAYAALLSPQGKFLHDFFVVNDGGDLLLDVAAERLPDLQKRLTMYRLRAKVEITVVEGWLCYALFGSGRPLPISESILFADPRLPALGWRLWLPDHNSHGLPVADAAVYEAHRLALGVPDGAKDIEIDKGLLLENHFEALHGVDFRKGCYIGQELTARTKYRGLVKKQLYRVTAQETDTLPAIGTPITANGQEVGQLRSSTGPAGLALLRLDAAQAGLALDAAGIALTAQRPDYAGPIPEAKA